MTDQGAAGLAAGRQPTDALVLREGNGAAPWVNNPPAQSAEKHPLLHISWTRAVAALRRYKWLALGIVLAGTALGVFATRMVAPVYEVHATVWIANERSAADKAEPIRGREVLHQTSWPELLTSFAILEKAVRKMSLYLAARPADSAVFAGFDTGDRFRTGAYDLQLVAGGQYRLLDQDGQQLDAGAVGDSIGRPLGFRWQPSAGAIPTEGNVKFTLVRPRDAAMALRNNITYTLPAESNLLRVTMTGVNPERITTIMNAVLEEFLVVAADLKKRSVSEAGKALSQQLSYAEKQLQDAEAALERFRVATITLPTEAAPGVTGGTAPTRDPVFESFFAQKVESDNLRRDRVALETTLAAIQRGQLDPSALWSVPAVATSPAPELKAALADYASKQASLRAAQRTYTDDHKIVRDLKVEVETIRTEAIPRLASALLAELRRREAAIGAQVAGTAVQLRGIPTRTTEETRLRRDVEARGALYSALKAKYDEATLAEATTVPDVSILDAPIAPEKPSFDRAPSIVFMAVLASIAAALAVVLLLDQFDKRFRYAEQATHEMGLDIIGVVPALQQTVPTLRDPIEASHAREAFRSIRLALMHAFEETGRGIVTITSPGPGDGKSLLSANLALSFADAKCRTLLIDGDIRRGGLHSKFGVERLPGFVDYLAGGLTLDRVLRSTDHERLTILPRGAAQLHGPELLLSPAMSALLEELEKMYDVVIMDSPPLGAGIDPFVLGTATGNMLLVLRSGETDKRMAQAKLKVLNRLPIRVLGAVLNATPSEGEFGYYSYLYSDLSEEVRGLPGDARPKTDGHPPIPVEAAPEATPLQPS
jgi:capsular exopolysaccharide synthesis family protein